MAPTREFSWNKGKDSKTLFIRESNTVFQKMLVVLSQLFKIWEGYNNKKTKTKKKTENIQEDHWRHQKSKQLELKIEKRYTKWRSKWAAAILMRLAEWNGTYIDKSQMKTSTNTSREENKATEKQLWNVNDWMKVIFSDESWICLNWGDNVILFVWYDSYKTKMLVWGKQTYSFII